MNRRRFLVGAVAAPALALPKHSVVAPTDFTDLKTILAETVLHVRGAHAITPARFVEQALKSAPFCASGTP